MDRIVNISKYYGSLKGMQRKFEKFARQDCFKGRTLSDFEAWKKNAKSILENLIGLKYMEKSPLNPVFEECVEVDNGILREKVIIQVEPETYMSVYILIPKTERQEALRCFLALPGHMGAGKYSVAGCYDIPAVNDKIKAFHYDYGMQLAKLGYVVLCPDCRGFGERRDEALQTNEEDAFLNSTCFHLAHMAEPLGETVIGMLTWDAMRLIDYVYERNQWDVNSIGCVGFSGGGMQTLWLAALDERIKYAVISGYMYGYKDSLLLLNGNCSCNYVPHLWRHFDMGDIASLIAPRPLMIQSCKDDDLNGYRGMQNVLEQIDIIKSAYSIYGGENALIHDIREGGHCFHPEALGDTLAVFGKL